MPQAEQKVALAGCSDPQAGQARWSGAPHSLQKRAPSGLSAPQEAQTNPTRRVYGERGTPDSGLAPFLFGRPLGGRKSFETLVRNRFAALDRKAVGTGGKSCLGTLDGGELLA